MNRRAFISLIGGAAMAWPRTTRAQQPVMPVIGYLGFTSPSDEVEMISSVRKGLREAGFDEGGNVSIEFRFAEGDEERHDLRRRFAIDPEQQSGLQARHPHRQRQRSE